MSLGDRMKTFEAASEQVMPLGLPVIVRLDGNSFSKMTNTSFEKPYDPRFDLHMDKAAEAVLSYCGSPKFAYIQSDEISLVLTNTPESDAFLGNRTQKLASLLASKAAVAFSMAMGQEVAFDCRVFVIPPDEVLSYFQWRQDDTFKNCISTYAYWELRKKVGRKTSQKMLHGLTTSERQELIFQELGVNPNDLPSAWKRGRCLWKIHREVPISSVMEQGKLRELVETGRVTTEDVVTRGFWDLDTEIPRFSENPTYLKWGRMVTP